VLCFVTVKLKCHIPLRVQSIDCHVIENATRHITKQYEQTKKQCPAHRSSAPQRPSAQQEDVPDPADVAPDTELVSDSAHQRVSAEEIPSSEQRPSAPEIPAAQEEVLATSEHSTHLAFDSQASGLVEQTPSAQDRVSEPTPDSAVLKSDSQIRASVSLHEDSIAYQSAHSHDGPPRVSVPQVSARMLAAFQPSDAQLVLRRGQKFAIELAFDRPYDRLRDDIIFTFNFGKCRPLR